MLMVSTIGPFLSNLLAMVYFKMISPQCLWLQMKFVLTQTSFDISSFFWSGEQQPVLSAGEDDGDDRAGREVAIPVLLLFVMIL